MIQLRTTLLWLWKATIMCLIAMLCGAVIYLAGCLLFSSNFRDSLLLRAGLYPGSYIYQQEPDSKVVMPIYQSHSSVVRWILGCAKISIVDLDGPTRFSMSWYPGRGPTDAERAAAREVAKLQTGGRFPVRQEWAVVQLSKSLADLRYQSQEKAESSYFLWQTSTLVTIALGMITTILVSLSSTEFGRDGAPAARIIRLLAIAFPAIGTAAAAAVAFYGPQTTWTQANRTLASATQLHGQMGLGIWHLKCIVNLEDAESPDPQRNVVAQAIEKQIADWEKQYTDIVALASAAGQSTSGGPAGQSPAGGTGDAGGKGVGAPPTVKQ